MNRSRRRKEADSSFPALSASLRRRLQTVRGEGSSDEWIAVGRFVPWLTLFMMHAAVALLIQMSVSGAPASSQSDTAEVRRFIDEILSQVPTKEILFYGELKLRHANGKLDKLPIKYSAIPGQREWLAIYETKEAAGIAAEKLVVIHRPDQPNEYLYTAAGETEPVRLTGDQAAIPFAKSDFWLSDLGLEFLHWPEQRRVRDPKVRTMKFGRSCKVIESINPHPNAQNYSRVVSWLDSESGGLIAAQSYDLNGKPFKDFSLKHFEKVAGAYQVKEMLLLDQKADTKTWLEFQFEKE